MITEKTINEIGSCKFGILITEFTARCRRGDIEVSGCGRLYLNENGTIKFDYSGVAKGCLSRPFKIGRIVDEEDLFVLEMVDQSGMTWTSSSVYLHYGGLSGMRFSEVVDLHSIESHSRYELNLGRSGNMWFGFKTGLPRNASSEIDMAIRITRKRRKSYGGASSLDRTIVRGVASRPSFKWKDNIGVCNYKITGENTANDLLQALFFVSGEFSRAYLIIERLGFWENTKIFSVGREVKITQSKPIRYNEFGDESREQIFTLFKKYISYIGQNKETVGYWNKITEDWYKVANVRGISIQLEMLSLCTTIEGKINSWHGGTSVKGIKSAEINKINVGIDDMDIEKLLKDRIKSIVNGALLNKRCIDIMHKLCHDDGITKNMIKTWKECRNPSAHGHMTSEIDDTVIAQRDILFSLLSLLYLKRINYRGNRTRYDIEGWPLGRVV